MASFIQDAAAGQYVSDGIKMSITVINDWSDLQLF